MNQTAKPTILVVDDTPDNIDLLCSLLKNDYHVKVAVNGERAIKIATSNTKPDLILLDIMMPGMSGYDVCRILKANSSTQDIPIIFITAMSDENDEKKGLEMGAVDYITKPISAPIMMARIKTQLSMKRMNDFLRNQNQFLETEVEIRTRKVMVLQDVTIYIMASLAETRDNETGNHIRRTANYVKALAEKLSTHIRFSHMLSAHNIALLFKSAPLHDIGKIGIPDRILLKPGRFEPHEMEIMKTHTTLGRNAILSAEKVLGISVDFLSYAKEIAYGHQEKWDGSGYPEGLMGDAIPISARLMAVADVYDALISQRVYKSGMSHEAAVGIISQGRGTHFDPDMVDAFLEIQYDFVDIAKRYADTKNE